MARLKTFVSMLETQFLSGVYISFAYDFVLRAPTEEWRSANNEHLASLSSRNAHIKRKRARPLSRSELASSSGERACTTPSRVRCDFSKDRGRTLAEATSARKRRSKTRQANPETLTLLPLNCRDQTNLLKQINQELAAPRQESNAWQVIPTSRPTHGPQ